MKLTDCLTPSLIKIPLAAARKQAAIEELVDLLASSDATRDRDALLRAVLEREAQRTTGIGLGFAVPHAKCDAVGRIQIAFGRTAEPIEFGSVDGKPVSLIALLTSPAAATSDHIQCLADLSRLVTNASVRDALLSAPDAASFYGVVEQHQA